MSTFAEILQVIGSTDIPLSVVFGPTPPYAMAEFKEDKFTITINPKHLVHAEVLLLHELSHVLDGDLNPDVREQFPNHKLHNMAADALINRDLIERTSSEDQEFIRDKGFTFANLVEKYPDLDPDLFHDRRSLYDELEQRMDQDQDQDLIPDFQPAKAETENTYTEALNKIRKGLKGVLIPDPNLIAAGSLTLQARVVDRSTKETKRTWRRPGVLPFLRSTTRIRTEKIGFALDVSGSYMNQWDRIYSQALSWIKNRVGSRDTALIGVFSYSCETYKGNRSSPLFGGGTYIEPVYRWAKENQLDRLVILTDGAYSDSGTPKPNNCIVEEIKT